MPEHPVLANTCDPEAESPTARLAVWAARLALDENRRHPRKCFRIQKFPCKQRIAEPGHVYGRGEVTTRRACSRSTDRRVGRLSVGPDPCGKCICRAGRQADRLHPGWGKDQGLESGLKRLACDPSLSVTGLAAIEGANPSYVDRILRLAFLSPAIVDAILSGEAPAELNLHRLKDVQLIAPSWGAQHRLLGISASCA